VGLDTVLELVRRTAGGAVDADAPLMEAGVDSLGAVELRSQLQQAAGVDVKLPSTLVFDHPTVRQLADYFVAQAPVMTVSLVSRVLDFGGGVCLSHLHAILPAGARGMQLAWHMATTGSDAFAPISAGRWDADVVRYGACMESVQLFDHTCFVISRAEVSTMDPQQRLLLEVGYEALHGAEYRKSGVSESDTGVFVGIMSTEFGALAESNAYTMTGTGHCFAAGRISYVLGLFGSCEAIDTACSSALVACHNARRSVQMQDCQAALTAGVNMFFLPATLDSYAASGLTASTGKAFVFDARADGFIRGEACSAGVLHDTATSTAMGWTPAVAGSAVRQDGRSASLTAPNGRAQQRLLSAVLVDARLTPENLQLLESAANGSAL